MFNNIGNKIKTVAETLCFLGIIVSVFIGLVFIAQGEDSILTGFLIMVLGSLVSWLGSFMTYGIGQLIENTDILVDKICEIEAQVQPKSAEEKLIMLRDWKDRGLITDEEFLYLIENDTV